MVTFDSTAAKNTATSGISSAGTNSLLPKRSAYARRCSGVVVRSVLRPGKPVPASAASASTASTATSGEPVPATTYVP